MAAAAGKRRDAMAAAYEETAKRFTAGITRCYRRAMILELRAVPCTLAEIGKLFGLQRERVRQIEMGLERPCACRACITG
jgi:DNA-directed RNA polymerase sigma subunit (sigma70/sigma32)